MTNEALIQQESLAVLETWGTNSFAEQVQCTGMSPPDAWAHWMSHKLCAHTGNSAASKWIRAREHKNLCNAATQHLILSIINQSSNGWISLIIVHVKHNRLVNYSYLDCATEEKNKTNKKKKQIVTWLAFTRNMK